MYKLKLRQHTGTKILRDCNEVVAGSHFAQKISLGPILLWTIRRRQLCRLPIHESDGEVQMTALILRWGLCLICWPPKPHNFPRKINWLWLCWRHMMIIGVHLLWTWRCHHSSQHQATLPQKVQFTLLWILSDRKVSWTVLQITLGMKIGLKGGN